MAKLSVSFTTAAWFGSALLLIVTVIGLFLSCHLFFRISLVCINSDESNGSSQKKGTAKLSKLFRVLCLMLVVFGSVELTLLWFNNLGYSRFIDMDGSFISATNRSLHGISILLLNMIFFLRLVVALKGSIYDYSSITYKIVLTICWLDLILGVSAVLLFAINTCLEETKNYHDEWFIEFIPRIIPDTVLPISLVIYLGLQVTLVSMLVRALKMVIKSKFVSPGLKLDGVSVGSDEDKTESQKPPLSLQQKSMLQVVSKLLVLVMMCTVATLFLIAMAVVRVTNDKLGMWLQTFMWIAMALDILAGIFTVYSQFDFGQWLYIKACKPCHASVFEICSKC